MKRPATAVAVPFLVCLLILLACLLWTDLRGQDVNWDLQNYHDYDAFILLHGRALRDVAPAGPQSFLNPLPYLLPYGLHRLLPARPAGLLVAAIQAIGLMLAWLLGRRLCRDPYATLAAAVAAITGPVVLTELGTSFSDLILAIPPLAALLLLTGSRSGSRSLLAGILTGAAIGIKPTSLFLLPALAAYAAMLERRAPAALRSAMLTIAGAMAGALLSDGFWATFLWRAYGSPVFPFMNTLFRSHAAALVDFGDPRFHFMGLGHALAIPFDLATGSDATGELPIRDARLAGAILAAILFLARTLTHRPRIPDKLAALCAFVLLGLAGWLVLCPIERYAAVLEILSGLLCVLILARLPGTMLPRSAAIAASLLLVATTRPADYFHRPWSAALPPVVPALVPSGATYGLLAQPLAYWVAIPPRPAHAFGLTSTLMETGGTLQRRLDRILQTDAGHLWLLNFDEPVDGQIRAEMGIHRIALAPPCLRTPSMIWIDTVFCRGMVTAPRTLAASDLAIGAATSFSTTGYGLIYEVGGFGATEFDGVWASGHDALLAIHLDPAIRAAGAILTLRLAGVGGAPSHAVTISADDARPRTMILAPSHPQAQAICIAPHPGADGTVAIRMRTDDTRSLAELGRGAEARPLAFKLYEIGLQAMRPASCR